MVKREPQVGVYLKPGLTLPHNSTNPRADTMTYDPHSKRGVILDLVIKQAGRGREQASETGARDKVKWYTRYYTFGPFIRFVGVF
jgi:hypothetical protein